MSLNGIDVSNLQGASFDWAPYKGRIQFAFIKATEGTGFRDPDYARNRAQAHADGLTVGAYHYLHPSEPGAAQAHCFLGYADPKPGELVMVDVETDDGRGPSPTSACAADFAATVHHATGAWPVAYTMQSFAEGGYCGSLGLCPSFIANPSHVTLPSPIGPWHLVSFEQTGQRSVDVDVFYGDLAELGKLAIPHPVTPPPHPLVTKAQAEQALAELVAYVARG